MANRRTIDMAAGKLPKQCVICNKPAGHGASTRSNNIIELFGRNRESTNQSESKSIPGTLSSILNRTISKETTHSNVICRNCTKLCDEYEELQKRLSSITTTITKNFNETLTTNGLPSSSVDDGDKVAVDKFDDEEEEEEQLVEPEQSNTIEETTNEDEIVTDENAKGLYGLIDYDYDNNVIYDDGGDAENINNDNNNSNINNYENTASSINYKNQLENTEIINSQQIYTKIEDACHNNNNNNASAINYTSNDSNVNEEFIISDAIGPGQEVIIDGDKILFINRSTMNNSNGQITLETGNITGTSVSSTASIMNVFNSTAPTSQTEYTEMNEFKHQHTNETLSNVDNNPDQENNDDVDDDVDADPDYVDDNNDDENEITDVQQMGYSFNGDNHQKDDTILNNSPSSTLYSNVVALKFNEHVNKKKVTKEILKFISHPKVNNGNEENSDDHDDGDDDDDDDDSNNDDHDNNIMDNRNKTASIIEVQSMFTRIDNKFYCSLCPINELEPSTPPISEYNAQSLMIHIKTVHSARIYICDVCGLDFYRRNALNEHMDIHAELQPNGEFVCEICNWSFQTIRLYNTHKKMHVKHKQKVYKCIECDKKLNSLKLLEAHMNMHTGNRPYVCQKCKKDFASKYTLSAHMKVHTDRVRPYKCDKCPKEFFNKQNLIQHDRTHDKVKRYECDVCQKMFATVQNLDVHRIIHSGHKPFICRTCGKAFARRAEINDHERTHTGERPFECDLCDMRFSQRSNLLTHKRATHYNDKRYKCTTCERTFKRQRLLQYHIKSTHTLERPHVCTICNASFVYPEHYKKHLRIHTGDKPYKCEICSRAFNSRDNRNAHRFIHSDKKPYECLMCGKGFMRKPLLLAHMHLVGHVSDTIIVNQPHVASNGKLITVSQQAARTGRLNDNQNRPTTRNAKKENDADADEVDYNEENDVIEGDDGDDDDDENDDDDDDDDYYVDEDDEDDIPIINDNQNDNESMSIIKTERDLHIEYDEDDEIYTEENDIQTNMDDNGDDDNDHREADDDDDDHKNTNIEILHDNQIIEEIEIETVYLEDQDDDDTATVMTTDDH